MSLTVDDMNAVRAQWEEWTADKGFTLSMKVCAVGVDAVLAEVMAGVDVAYELSDQLAARVHAESLYCQVEIRRPIASSNGVPGRWGERLVFSERVPYDADALRASVTVLARTIAGWDGIGEGDGDGA